MIKISIFMCISFGLLLMACSKDTSPLTGDKPELMRSLTAEEQYIADISGDFGLKLFKEISAGEEKKNLFVSPLSVSMALGMTMNGADSSTYTAMRQTLGFEGLSESEINNAYMSLIDLLTQADPKVIFEIANSIWYKDTFTINPVFLATNQKYFDATILPRNFSTPGTVEEINDWVSINTHGKITEIIDEIDPMTLMFLINAIYFKGTWLYEFEKEKTAQATFHLIDNQTSTCQMMQVEGNFNYYADEKVQIIDLPYGSGNFSMTVFLPRSTTDLDEFISTLDPLKWQNYNDQLDTAGVFLELPKFKLEYKLIMNQVLKSLGMGVAFEPGLADFGRIIDNMDLFISKVLHKTFVQVDEEGTEAAAVTVVEIKYTSTEPRGTSMRVDHPFMFVLREKQSGTILFMGKILQPEWTE